MAGHSWLVDSRRIATKIKCASETCDPGKVKWKSNPTRTCPKCNHTTDNSDVTQEWPGLPRGVKFDPSDQEIIWHLLSKVGVGDAKPHPFIEEFIPTVDEDDGICYTHPQNLPGVKQDGSVSHLFHTSIKAYNTGTRKRRKINGEDLGDVRWHKTGKTKPIILDGIQRGCKKIMVLYMSMVKGGKTEKTNWVMHQYHLGTGEDEKDGEFVISKIFFQQQAKQGDKIEQELPLDVDDPVIVKVDLITPKNVTPEPPRAERRCGIEPAPESAFCCIDRSAQHPETMFVQDGVNPDCEEPNNHMVDSTDNHDNHMVDGTDKHAGEDPKWWEGESQFLLDSQRLVEGLSLCDELLRSRSPARCDDDEGKRSKPCLSDYADIGAEHLKRDLEECQNLSLFDPSTIDLDTPPDFRLSQLDFGSQESFSAFAGNKVSD